jgi:hypothetical protein
MKMAKETRVWTDTQWVNLFVDDGNAKTTISLTYDEAFDLAQKLMPRAEFSPDALEELRMAARMIRRWIPEAFPENARGQIHFVRSVVESVAGTIERALAGETEPSEAA